VRYVRAGQISINAFGYQDDGGNYMHCGPVANNSGDPFVLGSVGEPQLTDDAKKFAYRHGGKLNAVFFDGHTETLGFEDSLKAGLYWPTGSRIINANYVRDANVRSGDVIK
jgi:prepilin-type processing-associated H-X9-DG protein